MGQKTHPIGFRVGITRRHDSRWYADKKDMPGLIKQDHKIRKFIKDQFYGAQIPRIEIDRTREQVRILVHCAKPGVLIGRKGAKVEQLRQDLAQMVGNRIQLDILEISKPELEGQIVAEQIADQLRRRMPLPPHAEEDARARPRARRPRRQAADQRPSRRRGHRAHRVARVGPGPAADAARGHPLRLHDRADHLRRHRRQGVGSIAASSARSRNDVVMRKERRNAPDA